MISPHREKKPESSSVVATVWGLSTPPVCSPFLLLQMAPHYNHLISLLAQCSVPGRANMTEQRVHSAFTMKWRPGVPSSIVVVLSFAVGANIETSLPLSLHLSFQPPYCPQGLKMAISLLTKIYCHLNLPSLSSTHATSMISGLTL